jgi:hypothetical protein
VAILKVLGTDELEDYLQRYSIVPRNDKVDSIVTHTR